MCLTKSQVDQTILGSTASVKHALTAVHTYIDHGDYILRPTAGRTFQGRTQFPSAGRSFPLPHFALHRHPLPFRRKTGHDHGGHHGSRRYGLPLHLFDLHVRLHRRPLPHVSKLPQPAPALWDRLRLHEEPRGDRLVLDLERFGGRVHVLPRAGTGLSGQKVRSDPRSDLGYPLQDTHHEPAHCDDELTLQEGLRGQEPPLALPLCSYAAAVRAVEGNLLGSVRSHSQERPLPA
mmetsp:Transcript_2298/g.5400  ORF Transcript_2298/g.5400 Transcript_2298/m.5400 type:complete len:234 (-) Transcript_2298:223-924(-)